MQLPVLPHELIGCVGEADVTRVRIALSGVPQTLLISLYCRAVESRRSDALVKDERAMELVSRIDYDFTRIKFSFCGGSSGARSWKPGAPVKETDHEA